MLGFTVYGIYTVLLLSLHCGTQDTCMYHARTVCSSEGKGGTIPCTVKTMIHTDRPCKANHHAPECLYSIVLYAEG